MYTLQDIEKRRLKSVHCHQASSFVQLQKELSGNLTIVYFVRLTANA